MGKYSFTSVFCRRQSLSIAMHFLRTLIFSALLCASAASAVNIPGEQVSNRLVISIIKGPLTAHTNVILCVYAFRRGLSSLVKKDDRQCNQRLCDTLDGTYCGPGCNCNFNTGIVSLSFRKNTRTTNRLISDNYSATKLPNS